MKALIVGDSTGALAAARELGRAGWTVGIGSPARMGWASVSRWTSKWHAVPAPVGDLETFIGAINQATAEVGYEVVFPATDAELLALSANRDDLTVPLPYAPHACVLRGVDKLQLEALAAANGFATPVTRDASAEALTDLGLPVVVKSRVHWNPSSPDEQIRVEAAVVHSREEALRQAEVMRAVGASPVFQQFAPGPLVAFTAVSDANHEILSQHARVTTLEHEAESGQVARATSIPVPDDLAANVQAFLTDIQWFGLMTLQFLRSEQDRFQLIDFNGRMDGEYALANACGMRGMDVWARAATGRDVGPIEGTVVGPRYQSIEADLRSAWGRSGAQRVSGCLASLIESAVTVHPIARWSDPMPALAYLTRFAQRVFRKF